MVKDLEKEKNMIIKIIKYLKVNIFICKRNGKGKEYYKDGELKYEGEYLNGKRNGKGKEYDNNSELEFERDYFHGKRIK